ncbi:MAG: multiheme c-type cytochrome [Planctomycetota bacterium]|jgi:hypothetical protein
MKHLSHRAAKSWPLLLCTLAATALLIAATSLEPTTDPAASTDPATDPAAEAAVEPAANLADNHYVGASKCKNCHKSDKGGAQYVHWTESKHAKAFEVLASDAAMAAAKELGIENPQESEKCLKCHETGYGEPEEAFAKGFKAQMGVQCESCHGQGEVHVKARFKAATAAKGGEVEPPAEGEILTNPPVATCTGCHNEESPSFKGFCFKCYSKQIRHLDPRKELSEERKAELDAGCEKGDDCANNPAKKG